MPPRRIQSPVRVVTPDRGSLLEVGGGRGGQPTVSPEGPVPAAGPVDDFTPTVRPGLPRGFTSPRVHLDIPKNLGRPPNSDDIQVVRGFDGLTPGEAVAKIAANLGDPVHSSNRAFVDDTIRSSHKAFTVAVNNAFIPGSPVHNRFHQMRSPVAIVGTMSAVHPTLIEVRHQPDKPTYYTRDGANLQRIDDMRYPIILRADLLWQPAPGVRVTHPQWRAPVLSDVTGTVIEG